MKSNANPSLIRKINRSAILDLIRTQGPISRTEIAEKLHTSLPTVMRITDDLKAQDLVREDGTFETSGGRPRALLVFNGDAHTVVGLDLGGTACMAPFPSSMEKSSKNKHPLGAESAEDNLNSFAPSSTAC